MKAVLAMTSVFTCTFLAHAEITGTLHRLPDGREEVRIRNGSASSVVAFAVTVKQVPHSYAGSHAPFVAYFDSLIDPSISPLRAGEDRLAMQRGVAVFKARTRAAAPPSPGIFDEPVLTAGIYADGSTTGDPTLLTRIILRRSNMLLAVETALETLLDAGTHNVPREQLIRQFRRMADSVHRWYVPPEQQAGRGIYQSIAGKLMNLPEEEIGMPFPPASFVAQETATLNQLRVRLLESQPSLADATLISTR